MTRSSFSDQLAALQASRSSGGTKPAIVAHNDNKREAKTPEPRYRGTLPALQWMYKNHPELAGAIAEAVQSLERTDWNPDAVDNNQEIRPTVGELITAATEYTGNDGVTQWKKPVIDRRNDETCVRLGPLKFVRGELVEYGKTGKGRKLKPRDRAVSRNEEPNKNRNPNLYVFGTRESIPSTMYSDSYRHPISDAPALAPMYDPQKGVENARSILRELGVDGSVSFEDLPFQATRCQAAIAKGAEFLGGVVRSSGNSSQGAVMWEAPELPKGEVMRVIEEVAARGTLQSIGECMGYSAGRADRAAKSLLVEAANILIAANDNKKRKKHAA